MERLWELMAIVEMSKLSVICLNSQKKRFIKELMDLGIVEINKPEGNSSEITAPRYLILMHRSPFTARLLILSTAIMREKAR